jgi:hypothetical protein
MPAKVHKLAIGFAAVAALLVGPVSAATAAESTSGTRTCAPPRSLGTHSTSPSGTVTHTHNTNVKIYTNSGTGTTYRYWNNGYSGISVSYVVRSSTSLVSAGSLCEA